MVTQHLTKDHFILSRSEWWQRAPRNAPMITCFPVFHWATDLKHKGHLLSHQLYPALTTIYGSFCTAACAKNQPQTLCTNNVKGLANTHNIVQFTLRLFKSSRHPVMEQRLPHTRKVSSHVLQIVKGEVSWIIQGLQIVCPSGWADICD